MSSQNYDCFDLDATIERIAQELNLKSSRVGAAVELLEAGNTLPFIARYRKEATGALDETELRHVEDMLGKLKELAQRKTTILKSIDEQGALSAELRKSIENCLDKKTLEEIYLPYKPKRRTRATAARERGLQPLADILLKQQSLQKSKRDTLQDFIDPQQEVPDAETALAGACDIVAEVWAEDPEIRRYLAEQAQGYGRVTSQIKRGKKSDEAAKKFEMYFEHSERLDRVPSHRLLAMKRGEAEGLLRLNISLDESFVLRNLHQRLIVNQRFEFRNELVETVQDCYQRLLLPATESAAFQGLKELADEEAIAVFGKNFRELLLAPPAGPKVTIGIDPGFRTGCKVAVVDGTGKFLSNTTIYPTPPKSDTAAAAKTLVQLVEKYRAELIAIGNGTASRETDKFVQDAIKENALNVTKIMVNESGASIYSASEIAVAEYPELDLTVRGAISIAHRLQDPLAELVKIDPKSIGVGQYQHDVNQSLLKKQLDREVESCVNSVGVDVNMASAPLLSYVAGIGPKLAERIVQHRDENGAFRNRQQLFDVPKLGKKAYEQAAGFLRIRGGEQPLDNSSVHPESYYVVAKMAKQLGVDSKQLVGNSTLASKLKPEDFVDAKAGLPTVQDIIAELAKPGRDPRSEFKVASFAEGINEVGDLKLGMVLEGSVTNVTNFGAFVDIGVHQDGLVHISELSNQYIQDPNEVVSVGDIIRVKVLDVDLERKRIALSRKQVSG
ncbi:MAG: hypothetical protein ACI9HK_003066 [Pirellulaceae bacterium]|jgi:uncharacterized protein